MARSQSRAAGNGGEAPRPAASERDRIIDAVLALIVTEGWRRLSLAAIAAEAGVPILALYRNFGSKGAILGGFLRRIDEAVLAQPPAPEADEKTRDRLFDLLMRRFEALQPYRPALEVLSRELRTDPLAALCLGTALLRSMAWMLAAADIATEGVRGVLAVKLTTAAYLSAARVWQRDDSPDMGRTMAALDQRLSRIERWLVPVARPPRGEAPVTA
jgi:AcrR family transcriptional regulator